MTRTWLPQLHLSLQIRGDTKIAVTTLPKKGKDKGTILVSLGDLHCFGDHKALSHPWLYTPHDHLFRLMFLSPLRHGNGSPNRILSLYDKEGSSEETWRLLGHNERNQPWGAFMSLLSRIRSERISEYTRILPNTYLIQVLD